MTRTSIQLSTETRDILFSMKKRGESYDDVIQRLLPNNKKFEDLVKKWEDAWKNAEPVNYGKLMSKHFQGD